MDLIVLYLILDVYPHKKKEMLSDLWNHHKILLYVILRAKSLDLGSTSNFTKLSLKNSTDALPKEPLWNVDDALANQPSNPNNPLKTQM